MENKDIKKIAMKRWSKKAPRCSDFIKGSLFFFLSNSPLSISLESIKKEPVVKNRLIKELELPLKARGV